MYKLWTFYKKSEDSKSQLIAWTNDKKVKNIYVEERDMKKLIQKTIELDDDEFEEFKVSYQLAMLDYRPYRTSKVLDDGTIDAVTETIVSTEFEYVSTTDDMYIPGLDESYFDYPLLPPPRTYSDKMRKVLRKLEYDYWYNMNKGVNEDYSVPDYVTIDEMSSFIRVYGDSFAD